MDSGLSCGCADKLGSRVENMEQPQSAQVISSFVPFKPATVAGTYRELSANKEAAEMGSTLNWPECIAVRTERRESQFRDGARSNRTVGSLNNQTFFFVYNGLKQLTNPQSITVQEKVMAEALT